MNVTVRLARAQDADAIHALNLSAFGYEYPLDKTRERVQIILAQPNNRIFVACEQNGRVIGYAHTADYENTYSDSMKNLMALAVDETCRGMGVGKKLLTAVEGWARECGCAAVRLVSGFNREGAHKFYQCCGYALCKNQKNFIKNLGDAL